MNNFGRVSPAPDYKNRSEATLNFSLSLFINKEVNKYGFYDRT